jgi:HSP20 family protein
MSMLARWEPFKTRMNPFRELEEMEKRLSTIFGRPRRRKRSYDHG